MKSLYLVPLPIPPVALPFIPLMVSDGLEIKLYFRGNAHLRKPILFPGVKKTHLDSPSLSRMTRDYLSVPAEEIFSTVGGVVSKNRNKLVGKSTRMSKG
jgi:hypothetical protein